MDDVEQDIIDKVDEFGWMIISVGPREGGDEPEEWFAYTVGLSKTFGWPEFICFGLEADVVKTILNNAVKECRDRSADPHAGMVLHDVAEGFVVRLAEVGEWRRNYIGWAEWFAVQAGVLRHPIDCLQLLWPDRAGIFPDEPGCNDGTRRLQTPVEVDA